MSSLVREILIEVSDNRKALLLKQYPDVTEEQFEQVVRCDPTNGSYTPWILKLFVAGSIRLPEDEEKVKQRLGEFDSLKKKRGFEGHRDINKYKSFGELAQTVQANSGVKTKGEIKKELAVNGAELIGEKDDMKLYRVTTNEAGLALGWRDTEWCVKDPKFFDDYGPPFYCIVKGGEPFKLLHMGSDDGVTPQCMDVYDEGTRIREFEQLGLDITPIFDWNLDWAAGEQAEIETKLETRWTSLEKYLLKHKSTYAIAMYVRESHMGRWPEAEPILLAGIAAHALLYWFNATRGKRWPELEKKLLAEEDPIDLMSYARRMIHIIGRWREAEPFIMKDPEMAVFYAVEIIGDAWPEAEEYIKRDPGQSLKYAKQVLGGRWHDGEAAIRKSGSLWHAYKDWLHTHFRVEV